MSRIARRGPLTPSAQQREGEGVSLIALALLAMLLLLPLASCGKKGPLEPPSGESNSYPRAYPRE